MKKIYLTIPLLTLALIATGCAAKNTTSTNEVNTNTADTEASAVNTNQLAETNTFVTPTEEGGDVAEDATVTELTSSYTFIELGFSMELPFSTEDVKTTFTTCDRDQACDQLGYSYTASFTDASNEEYVFLRAISEGWSPARRAQFGEQYEYRGDEAEELQVSGGTVLFYEDSERDIEGKVTDNKYLVASVALPGNDYFKTATLFFDQSQFNREEVIKALNTIKFDS